MVFFLAIILVVWIAYMINRDPKSPVDSHLQNKLQETNLQFRVDELEKMMRYTQTRLARFEAQLNGGKPVAEEPPPPVLEILPAPKPVIPVPTQPLVRPLSVEAPKVVTRPVVSRPAPAMRTASITESIDWEKFMGVKLFAWLGGFALFLGMAFFVKYSIDHNLISPLMRVIIGLFMGIGVIIAGLSLQRKNLDVTVQTLCASGIAILYADIFACRSFYNFLSPAAAFPLMILVTVTAFFLAVRLNSKYVAILALLGGFLTPVMLSTGENHAIALFSYILMLDIGLAAIAYQKRWGFLSTMSAIATLLMEFGWSLKFFDASQALIGACVYFLFSAFYVITSEFGRERLEGDVLYHGPRDLMTLASMGFVGMMLNDAALAVQPGLVLTLLLALSALMSYTAVRREESRPWYIFGGVVTFTLLTIWTVFDLKAELLYWGLGYYMAFAILHAGLPMWLQRGKSGKTPFTFGFAAPVLMLALILFAMLFGNLLSFIFWPVIFLMTMLAVVMAWVAGSIIAIAAALILMTGSFAVWMFRLPDVAGLPGILMVLAFFSCAFFALMLVIASQTTRLKNMTTKWPQILPEEAAQMPALAALMPFMLLAMVCMRLPLANPSDVFGLMLLMVILLLGLVRYRKFDVLAIVALGCTVLVEGVWHLESFKATSLLVPTVWYGIFYAVFTLFPFLIKKHIKGVAPWIASALAGLLHFWFFYKIVMATPAAPMIGLLPGLMAMPALFGLWEISRLIPKSDERRSTLLALWGGIALFFITLIIPLQFDREWITLGWTLEGAALLWLNRRVVHDGLVLWGTSLLGISFVRLAMNPAVFSYHPRAATPIFNWYLFVYGVAALSFYAAARFVAPPRNKAGDYDMPPVFNSLGTVLTFLLLNIEIADFFSTGPTITFQFSGNLAQDMTYSLLWAIFAIVLLGVGIKANSKGGRYASIGLLTVTLCKLFLHDLWQLGGLYRVASFVGLAFVLITVSFLYQKFLAKDLSTEVRHD